MITCKYYTNAFLQDNDRKIFLVCVDQSVEVGDYIATKAFVSIVKSLIILNETVSNSFLKGVLMAATYGDYDDETQFFQQSHV